MRIIKWNTISCDLSYTAISEGIKQYKQQFPFENVFCIVHPEYSWVLDIHKSITEDELKKYSMDKDLLNIPFMLHKSVSKNTFIMIGDKGILLGPDLMVE